MKRWFIFLLFVLLFCAPVVKAEKLPDYQASKRALSDSFFGVRDGMGSIGRGFWGLTVNTGKLFWYGTREGLTKGARGAKKADRWMQKNLW